LNRCQYCTAAEPLPADTGEQPAPTKSRASNVNPLQFPLMSPQNSSRVTSVPFQLLLPTARMAARPNNVHIFYKAACKIAPKRNPA
jgi:hypothetical protein